MKQDNTSKIAGMPNPALFVDDAIDAYMLYNNSLPQNKQKRRNNVYKTPVDKNRIEKFAGFYDGITGLAAETTYKVLNDPKLLIPSAYNATTMGTGIVASMYAPEWAGGPGDGEDIVSLKRMARNALVYRTLGATARFVPTHVTNLNAAINSGSAKNIAISSAKLAPTAAVAYNIVKPIVVKEEIKGKPILKGYSRGKFVSNIPDIVQFLQGVATAGGL